MNQAGNKSVADSGNDTFDYSRILPALMAERLTVAWVIAALLCVAVYYLLVTPPTYRSDSLLQVQDATGMSLPGMSLLAEFSGSPTGTSETEIQIIRSRSVSGEAVNNLNLSTEVEPQYFPILGYAIARFRSIPDDVNTGVKDAEDGFWLSNYLWTPGRMRVDRFVVPEYLYGEPFTVRAISRDQYVLFGPDGQRILAGKTGDVSSGEIESSVRIEIFIREFAASAYPSDYTVSRRHWLEAVTELQTQLSVTELGRDSRIVKISLEGHDREEITQIINNIAETYLRQNVEARSQQARRRLDILERQLPALKDAVDSAELRLNKYREDNLALDLGAEARSVLEKVVEIDKQKSEFELKRAELSQTYTEQHPYLRAIDDQMRSLERSKRQLEIEIEALPEAQREMLGLTRDVGVNTAVYMESLNKAQELRLVESGAVGNVRIIDKAVLPVEPVKPQAFMVLVAATILGTMTGVAAALIRSFYSR